MLALFPILSGFREHVSSCRALAVGRVRRLLVIVGVITLCGYGFASSVLNESRETYAARVAKSYSYRFGRGVPFLPSNAQIAGGTFIQAGAFPTAQYCQGCHESIYHQWRQSLHANSFRTPFYTKNVGLLQNSKGIEFSRHCEGCHNPIELFSGLVTPRPASTNREFDQDGVTCMVCHSIQKLQPAYGVGSYVMGVPAVMLDEQGHPISGEVDYSEILDHVDRHKAAVMKDFYRTAEYCAACHKANIPATLNDYKWLRAIGLYDEWQQSAYSNESPLPPYREPRQTCQNCHMPGEAAEQDDAAAKGGTVASHRWIGGNTAVPFLYAYDEQLKKTLDFLKANKLNIDIFALTRPNGLELIAPLGSTAFNIEPGNDLQAMVVIENNGIGHTLIPEQRDMYEAWADFELRDARGKVLEASGRLDSTGYLDPDAHTFITRLVDGDGHLLVKHEIWQRKSVGCDATIPPGHSALIRYQFHIPNVGAGPYTITARVKYRHFNKVFTNFVLGGNHPPYPVAEMAVQTRELKIGGNQPHVSSTSAPPDWMRWNNFGIAVLDQEQFGLAQQAFEEVTKLRPDYADAYTNLGITYIHWHRYPDARTSLRHVLDMTPSDPRASYYFAVLQQLQGNLDGAAQALIRLSSQFPRSIDTRRELALVYYQQHHYDLAKREYEAVQAIDPDDLAAHYGLALLYQLSGDDAKASIEMSRFSDKKSDPSAAAVAMRFLSTNPDFSTESIPWHLHTAVEVPPAASVAAVNR